MEINTHSAVLRLLGPIRDQLGLFSTNDHALIGLILLR